MADLEAGEQALSAGENSSAWQRQRPKLPAGPFLVLGLARSGAAAALALRARGEQVQGVDAQQPKRGDELVAAGVQVHCGTEVDVDLSSVATLIKSPGVPADAPILQRARAAGVLIMGELELGWRLNCAPMIAVTGTNGKTTTVELIGHILRSAGLRVAVAGNVGRALSELALLPEPLDWIVCEVSSFQLEDAVSFAPQIALLLNLTPDHLDRHGSFEAYRAAKLRIFARQVAGDVAILPSDLQFDSGPIADGVRQLRFDGAGMSLPIARDQLQLPGAHNLKNCLAASAACLQAGLTADALAEGLRTFTGVEHRLQELPQRGGVRYFNDSKATNVQSTLTALKALCPDVNAGAERPLPDGGAPTAQGNAKVHLILGGQGKGQDFAPLARGLAGRVRAVYLIGEDAGLIAAAVESGSARSGPDAVRIEHCGQLAEALRRANAAAQPGEIVLLSPACASFDQFEDFQQRGERFMQLVASGAAS